MRAQGTERRADRDLIERCLQTLQKLIPVDDWTVKDPPPGTGRRWDAYLNLRIEGHQVHYIVEAKHNLRKPHIGPLMHLARDLEQQGERLLVCADRIPEELGEQFREQGLAYLDLGGNAFLRAPGLFVLVKGRPRVALDGRRQALTKTDVVLLGVFLRDPDACEAVQQEVARRAGIALGGVGRAREKLLRLGLLKKTKNRQWYVTDRAQGLRRFGEGWGAVVRHKLRPRNYRMLDLKKLGDLEQRLAATDPELGCLLGGERAAGHLTRFLHTDHATLHVRPGQQRATADELMLVPDENGPVTVLERYGEGDEYHLKGLGIPLAHPLLVWAECQTVPDERVAQAARLLYDRLLEADHE